MTLICVMLAPGFNRYKSGNWLRLELWRDDWAGKPASGDTFQAAMVYRICKVGGSSPGNGALAVGLGCSAGAVGRMQTKSYDF